MHEVTIKINPVTEFPLNPNSANRIAHDNMLINITFLIPNLFIKKGMARINSVSDICEMERMMVEKLGKMKLDDIYKAIVEAHKKTV